MKCFVVFVAVAALVSASEEKKPAKEEEKKPAADEKRGLVWPLPDPVSEGDLMLHGSISYDRVRALHKAKLEDDVDKMILAHGRQFLHRVSKFFDDNADFKIVPALCRDTRNLNATSSRWRIEIPKPQAAPAEKKQEAVERDQAIPANDVSRNSTNENDTVIINIVINATTASLPTSGSSSIAPTTSGPISSSSALPSDKPTDKPTDKPSEKPTEKPVSTTVKPTDAPKPEERDSFEVRRRDFYRLVGANFARLLMKEYRKEPLVAEETEFLARWIADEAVHYGAAAIYCNEGENVKEIKKQLAVILEEKK